MNCESCNTPTCYDNVINPFEELACIERQGVPLIRIFKWKYGGIMSGLFDFVYGQDGTMTFKMKSNPSIMPRETGANGEIYWKEQIVSRPKTTVATAATASNTLVVSDVSELLGIGAGAKIHVTQADGTLKIVTVASITWNTITLVAGQTVTAAVGACVYRGAYSVDKSCTNKADNQYSLRKEGVKHTYFRRLYVTYEFNVEDFNVEKCRYIGQGTSAQDYLDALMKAWSEGFQREFVDAVFTDRNAAKWTVVAGQTVVANETMGILPAIDKAQADTGVTLIRDFADCCAGAGTSCEKDEKVVRQFLSEIAAAARSGSFDDTREITVLINNAQIEALIDLAEVFAAYKGVQIIQNGQGERNFIFNPFTVQYGWYSVSFEYEEWMDSFTAPLYIILPKTKILFMQRKFADMSMSGDKAKLVTANTFVSNGFPVAKFVDRTKEETNGEGDCHIYRAFLDFAIALPNICGWGYRAGINFQSCGFTCEACAPATPTTLLS